MTKFLNYWKVKFRLLLISFLMTSAVVAQSEYSLTGTVISKKDNLPLPGVNVIIKDSQKGVVTDFDGNYSIEVKESDILEFSSIGYKTEVVIIENQQTLDIALSEDIAALETVVVIGYGTQKQKNVTGSQARVTSKDIQNTSNSRVEQSIVGKLAGVNILTTSTEAGADPRITIRGTGSISGSSAPLIVVDGFPLGTDPDILGSINSNNIESIDILKDAASTAIYGSRGANGVVLVTLKEGKVGDTKFSYDTYTGIRYANRNDNFTTSIDDEDARLESFRPTLNALSDDNPNKDRILGRFTTAKAELAAAREIANASGGETEWQDFLFPGGTVTSHSFSARGGSELTKFNASIGYLEDEGILIEDNFQKINARIDIKSSTRNKKIKYGGNIAAYNTKQDRVAGGLTDGLRQSRFLPLILNEDNIRFINRNRSEVDVDFADFQVGDIPQERAFDRVFIRDGEDILRDAEGNPILITELTDDELAALGNPGGLQLSTTGNVSPVANYTERQRFKGQNRLQGTSFIDFKLAKGLNFVQKVSGEYRITRNTEKRGLLSNQRRPSRSLRSEQVNTIEHYTIESNIKYKKKFGNHRIDVFGAFTFENFDYTFQESNGEGNFVNDDTSNIPLAAQAVTFTQLGSEKLVSYFGRFRYNYNDKYLLNVTARTDGSSRFGSDRRYGFFPSASLGWVVSNEGFLSESNIITNLKLRGSFGISGANDIDRNIFNSIFRSQSLLQPVSFSGQQGVKFTTIPNNDLGWEQNEELNLGIDLQLWEGALSIKADHFIKTSRDLILSLPVPAALGAQSSLQNIGQVENVGYELELSSEVFKREHIRWNISGQISTVKNEVKSLGGQDQIISAITQDSRPTEFITRVGGPISSFFGFVYDREIPIEQVNDPFARFDADPANVFVKDLNGDGVIDGEDRTEIGNPFPDFTWGLSSNLNIYNFDMSFQIQGSHGAEVRLADLDQLRHSSVSNLNPLGSFEDIDLTRHRRFTDDQIQDASFVALRNVNLGYTLPRELTDKVKLEKVRFYISGDNLVFLFADGYEGFNPEGRQQTGSNANTPITQGYQRGDGPISRTVSLGFNLQF